jgi:excisionase family DNA binding protein
VPPRFLQLADVAEMLSISTRQAYALVQTGELPAIQVGGRRQWRIEATELEAYIQRMYAQTRARIEARPETDPADADADVEESYES